MSEFLEPSSLSELWEPLCRTDGSNPFSFVFFLDERIILAFFFAALSSCTCSLGIISLDFLPTIVWGQYKSINKPALDAVNVMSALFRVGEHQKK